MKEWCIPEADADFVAKMEDVLEVYQRPYDPLYPVVCIDETNKPLIEETRIPCEPGHPEKVDSVYVRNGVADVFMISEPLAGRRETVVTQTRTALDFAGILKYTSDTLYPRTERIILVTDNLNTHSWASLYKAFPPGGSTQTDRTLIQKWLLKSFGMIRKYDAYSSGWIKYSVCCFADRKSVKTAHINISSI